MTREEAIRQIENRWSIMDYGESEALGEALDMAIEALHQKGAYEQTKWERDVALQTLEEHGIGLGQKAEYIIPSGDVMFTSEVVRCKDCRWRKGICCGHEDAMVNLCDDSFCSYGERREPKNE